MSTATYSGVVRGGSVVLEDSPTPLPEGTPVTVTPVPEPGTPAALLAAIQAEPHLAAEDVAELEAVLESGGEEIVMDAHYPTIDQLATAEYVLAVLRDEHRQQCQYDSAADADASLSFDTTIQE
jgi:hypothetical protein